MGAPTDAIQVYRKKALRSRYWQHRQLMLMLVPTVVFVLIFSYAPMYGLVMAFQDFQPLNGIAGSPWVGFDHFVEMASGPGFWPVFGNTLIISFFKLLIGFPAPIALAVLLNEIRLKKFKSAAQTITYLPHILSWVVLSGIVIETLSPSRGPINWLIGQLGMNPIFFVGSEEWFRQVVVGSSVWRDMGFNAIIFLAAITAIDPELYDVAALDGAGRLQRILHITMPSILPVIAIMAIFSVGDLINDDFDQIFNLLNPNVYSVGDVVSTYTYREGLVNMNYSYATAVGLFKNVIAFVLVLGMNHLAKKTSGQGIM